MEIKFLGKRGLAADSLTSIIIWIVFLVLGIGAVYFLIKRLTG